jgi:hypothetical protein
MGLFSRGCCLRHREGTDLLHQAKLVVLVPGLDELAIRNTENFGHAKINLCAGWGNTQKFTGVGTFNPPSQNQFIPFCNNIFDRRMKIGKTCKKSLPEATNSFPTFKNFSIRPMVDVIKCLQLECFIELSLIDQPQNLVN